MSKNQNPSSFEHLPFRAERFDESEMQERAKSFYNLMNRRRSIRRFSKEPVSLEMIRIAIHTASTAPSGANKQPWTFCVVGDAEIKKRIRAAAEEEEYRSYKERMSEQWLKDLEPLGTDHHKPFLEEAPYLIVVFKKPYELMDEQKIPNYYVNESVGIAVGVLICALQNLGLASLTHTPSPMNFLSEILDRPSNERPYLLIPVGYPHPESTVPHISRKPLSRVLHEYF
jgi:nitroreductase